MRHSESISNKTGINKKDSPLSEYGIKQCKKLKGKYDIIICSNTIRAKQTVKYSKIKYDKLIVSELCKEDYFYDDEKKMKKSSKELIKLLKKNRGKKILVISHKTYLKKLLNVKELNNLEKIRIKWEEFDTFPFKY